MSADAVKEEPDIKEETNVYDAASLPSYLPVYYKLLFPYKPYYSWLSYGGAQSTTMANREFSFTVQNDIYIRYKSFASQQEMQKEIQKLNPHKIDIGAVYSHPPKDHNRYHSGAFKPVEKEVVFDIDMTDYDDVRKCCQGADICKKCWPLMTMAIKLIDRALKEDFGFKHRLWVYSGRRGVHCWVCDETARKSPNKTRAAIVEYLSLIQGGNKEKRVHLKDPVHPFLRHCISIISKQHWGSYCEEQDLLSQSSDIEKVLRMIPDDEVKEKLEKEFMTNGGTTDYRWNLMKDTFQKYYSSDPKKYRKLRYAIQEIMMEFCYPRLDANVTTGINHLLKSPFCVHPKTGRVCIPIDVSRVDEFDPFSVPTISQLCHELDSQKADAANDKEDEPATQSRKTHLYKKTSLAEPVEIFENFVNNLLADAKKQAQPKAETVDF